MKKTLILSLTIFLVISLFLTGCNGNMSGTKKENPASDFEYNIKNNEVEILEYIGEGKEVVIPSKIENVPVSVIGWEAFCRCDITYVHIPDTVKSIERWAFRDCKELVEVELGNSVEVIGGGAFERCTLLEKIQIPESVITIDQVAFFKCNSLKKVILPKNVKEISAEAFSECASLEEVYIPNSVEKWGYCAFFNNPSLAKITFEDGLKSIGTGNEFGTFKVAGALKTLTIPASVDKIVNEAFSYCDNLETVYFEGDAPSTIGYYVFGEPNKEIKIYYKKGTKGWDSDIFSDYTLVEH